MDDDDPRAIELETITAIYPELQVDEKDPFTVFIDIPVSLDSPLAVYFPASGVGAPVASLQDVVEPLPTVAVDSQALSNLPPLQVRITLPAGYPQDKPPIATVTTSPPWLDAEITRKLEHDAERLWDEIGRDQVIFTYIDDLQQSTADIFGLASSKGVLEVSPEHKIAILDYDNAAKRRAFERGTFDCGICLGRSCVALLAYEHIFLTYSKEPKKGSACHKMLDCGHVFCVQCLKDFYNNAITEGDIAAVQCLEPSCAKERGTAQMQAVDAAKRKKPKTFISPSELLQIPLETEMVMRYVTLKHKTELESDKNTVYCPRSWCQGAARSKKHRKPEGLEFSAQSDDESDGEDSAKTKTAADYRKDLLAICEDCGFAFCSRCGQSWHGEFKYCIPKERKEAITEEEKASLEYVKMHTTPCPTCAAPAQKTQGCNHMLCFRCQTHFCYLCSSWLDPSNPYGHFNKQPDGKINSCYMRLWELEGGDGQDVGIGYGGAGDGPVAVEIPPEEHIVLDPQEVAALMEAEERIVGDQLAPNAAPVNGNNGNRQPERVEFAREGPLVLRIGGDVPRERPRDAAAEVGAVAAQRGGGRGRGRGAGRGNRGNQRGGGGVGRGLGDNQPGRRAARNQQPQAANNRPAAAPAPPNGGAGIGDILRQGGELNEAQQAWVRHFVQMALNDQEDEVDWDSGDEI